MPEVLGQDSPPSLLVNCLLIKYSSSLQCIHTAQVPFSTVRHSALITLVSGRQKQPGLSVLMCVLIEIEA